jgi:DNA-binding phage protein
MKKPKAAVSHRERLIDELRANPKAARAYLAAAIEDADRRTLRVALRTAVEACNMARMAEKAGNPHESRCRTSSPNSDEQHQEARALLTMLAQRSEIIHEGRSKSVLGYPQARQGTPRVKHCRVRPVAHAITTAAIPASIVVQAGLASLA